MFLVLAAIGLALVSVPTPFASQEDNTALPITLSARVIGTNEQDVCPPSDPSNHCMECKANSGTPLYLMMQKR